jgi:peptide chain release factor 2
VEDDSIEIVIRPDDIEMDVFRAIRRRRPARQPDRIGRAPAPLAQRAWWWNARPNAASTKTATAPCKCCKSRLYELEVRKRQEEKDKVEAGKSKIEWGSQIRSYVLDDRWVKDLRSGHKVHNPMPCSTATSRVFSRPI